LKTRLWIYPALLALAACASPPVAPPSVLISRERSVVDLPETPALLRIENAFGDINLRISDKPQLGLHAVIQQIGNRPPPRLQTGASADGFAVSVEGLRGDPQHRHGRLDLTVFAPSSWALSLRTSDGTVRARDVTQPLVVRTVSGDILLRAAGDVDLQTRSGDIAASLSATKFTRAANVITDSGRIALGVPIDASIEVKASAGSNLSEVLGVAPVHSTARSAHFVLHGGGPVLTVRSQTGAVALTPITRL
jgi:Putative adhesin